MNLSKFTTYSIITISLIAASTATSAALIASYQDLPKRQSETAKLLAKDRLYLKAQDALSSGNWDECEKYFEILQGKYTLSNFVRQAQINIAYCEWKNNDLTSAEQSINRFIQFNPDHPSTSYAYYFKGIIHFNRDSWLLNKLFSQDISERDPQTLQESFNAFKILVSRFPKSRYALDAAARMLYIRNKLALHEIYVADYYYRLGAYIAALNRAQTVIKEYRDVPKAIEDALDIMILSYDRLNKPNNSENIKHILVTLFPKSHYIIENYERSATKRAWWQF
ncbi:MAG: outer membrane protein assembly factor BamD [Burkholderia sp.]|nr:outer membrane protein assembly factor BamD [Burkholderia sp.]